MSKCSTCGKEIKNIYSLDEKIYGYNCYKMAVAKKYIHMQDMKNKDYNNKCIALIETFKNKDYSRGKKWNQEFQESIIKQWEECQKLTIKQFECVKTKIDNIDYINYLFLYFALSDDKDKRESTRELLSLIEKDQNTLLHYSEDPRLHELIKFKNRRRIEKGEKYFIVVYQMTNCEGILDAQNIVEVSNQADYNYIVNEEKDGEAKINRVIFV